MNKEEAKQKLHNLAFAKLDTKPDDLKLADVMQIVNQIDEPQAGQAEQAPRYVKNILARLRELPLHDREVWLKAIMGEFEQDFSHAKWREGYEQGKLDGAWVGNQLKDADKIRQELNKPVVKQFVADWYEENKDDFEIKLFRFIESLSEPCTENDPIEFIEWLIDDNTKPFQTLVNMHQFGYEVEKEKRYVVTLKKRQPFVKSQSGSILYFSQDITAGNYKVTKKELEKAGFGWVFDCPGIKIEEVKDE
jgi:gp178